MSAISPDVTAFVVFIGVYAAMALGHLPGLQVDRTGAALTGALVLVATGVLGAQAAWNAIDYRTIGLLFGLMIVSSAFVVSGFYAWAAARVATLEVGPRTLLAVLIGTSAVLSSLLTNDVVVVAMTPLLVAVTLARGLNPVPFLLGFCFASNTGSVATIVGSPQNMIVAQGLHLSFLGFTAVTIVPALISLPIVWGVLALLYRKQWRLDPAPTSVASGAPPPVAVDHWESAKAAVIVLGVMAAFVLTDWPREQVALGAGGVLLLNRTISSTDMLKQVDGNLILLLIGLFIVNTALAQTGLPQTLLADLRAEGIDLRHPMWLLAVGAAVSNIVGNNPTVMLLVPYVAGAEPNAAGAALALGTGFSSNFVVFGSLAGIIVVEAAARQGIRISFGEFTRAGGWVALITLGLAAAWILALG
jgi:Na+/H+ antiporter NhaD/arsenite permease-like protein